MAKNKLGKKHLGKKGIFLTFIAISIIAAFIIIFTPSDISLKKDIPVIKTRVSNVNEYVVDLESVYLERALQSIGTKTIISLIKYMESQNQFLTNFESAFIEVLLFGTIGGTPIDDFIDPDIMTGNTYNDWINYIKTIADDSLNVNSNFNIYGVRVYQENPWFVNVDANISLSVSSETASWNKNITVTADIDIQFFDDPYYSINTAGSYVNRINRSDVQDVEWEPNLVKDHIRHGTYAHFEDSKAPSFIMRFTNTSLSSSCCGIESLVDPNKLIIIDQFESYADYLFFNHTYFNRCTETFNVSSLWPEFKPIKLEFEHLVFYNVTTGAVRTC